MSRRTCGCAIPLLLLITAGCGVDSDFSASRSETIFDDANAELHRMHLDAFELEDWPMRATHECSGGGTIEMDTVFRTGGSFEHLGHIFNACTLGELTFSGNLDYLDISEPDCNGNPGFAFDIDGDLEVTGGAEGSCAIRARESCGVFTGTTCGYDI